MSMTDPLPNHKQRLITAVVAVVALIQGFANAVGVEVGFLDSIQSQIENYSSAITVGALWALRLALKR